MSQMTLGTITPAGFIHTAAGSIVRSWDPVNNRLTIDIVRVAQVDGSFTQQPTFVRIKRTRSGTVTSPFGTLHAAFVLLGESLVVATPPPDINTAHFYYETSTGTAYPLLRVVFNLPAPVHGDTYTMVLGASVGSLPASAEFAFTEFSLSITPASASIAGGSAQASTVHRTGDTTASMVVTLSSSSQSVATVPVSVTIPAGSTSAPFDVTAVGAGSATITATSGSISTTQAITVTAPDPSGAASIVTTAFRAIMLSEVFHTRSTMHAHLITANFDPNPDGPLTSLTRGGFAGYAIEPIVVINANAPNYAPSVNVSGANPQVVFDDVEFTNDSNSVVSIFGVAITDATLASLDRPAAVYKFLEPRLLPPFGRVRIPMAWLGKACGV